MLRTESNNNSCISMKKRVCLILIFYLHCNSGREIRYLFNIIWSMQLWSLCQDVRNDDFESDFILFIFFCSYAFVQIAFCVNTSAGVYFIFRIYKMFELDGMNGINKNNIIRFPITIANFNYHLLRDITVECASCQLFSSINEMPPPPLALWNAHPTLCRCIKLYKNKSFAR